MFYEWKHCFFENHQGHLTLPGNNGRLRDHATYWHEPQYPRPGVEGLSGGVTWSQNSHVIGVTWLESHGEVGGGREKEEVVHQDHVPVETMFDALPTCAHLHACALPCSFHLRPRGIIIFSMHNCMVCALCTVHPCASAKRPLVFSHFFGNFPFNTVFYRFKAILHSIFVSF